MGDPWQLEQLAAAVRRRRTILDAGRIDSEEAGMSRCWSVFRVERPPSLGVPRGAWGRCVVLWRDDPRGREAAEWGGQLSRRTLPRRRWSNTRGGMVVERVAQVAHVPHTSPTSRMPPSQESTRLSSR